MIVRTEKTRNGFFESIAEARTANTVKSRVSEKTSADGKENFGETLNSVNNSVRDTKNAEPKTKMKIQTQEKSAAKTVEIKIAKYAAAAKKEGEEISVDIDMDAAKFAVEVENVNSSVVEMNLINAQDFGFNMKMNAVENIEEVLRAVSEIMNLNIDTNLPMVNFDVEEVPQEIIEQLAELLVIFKDISAAFLETGIKNEGIENRGVVYTPEQALATGQYLQQEVLKLELSFAELGITEKVAQEAMKISPNIEANTGLHFAADLETKTPAQQILPKTLENVLGNENAKTDAGEIKNIVERLKEAMSTTQNSSANASVKAENIENAQSANTVIENAAKAPVIEALSGLKKEIMKEAKTEVKVEAKAAIENKESAKVETAKPEVKAETEIKTEVKDTAKETLENKDTAKETTVKTEVKTEKEIAKEAVKETIKETAKKAEVKETVKTETKTEAKAEIKSEIKPETKAEVKETVKTTVENTETAVKTKVETKESAEVKTEVKSEAKPTDEAETKVNTKKSYAKNEAQVQAKTNNVLNNEFVSPIRDSMIRSTEGNIASPVVLDGVSFEANKFSDAGEIQSVSPRFVKLFEKEIVEQVQKTILSAANKNGSHKISLTLNPEKLGEVKLTIQVEGNVVSAKMNVENSQVKNIIEQNLQQLKEALGKQDLTTGSLDVNVGGENEARDLQERLHNARIRAQDRTGFNGEEGVITDEQQFETGVDTGRRYGNNSFEFFA